MPQLLDHIDAIARGQGRDVLWVTFYDVRRFPTQGLGPQERARRTAFIAYLDQQQIPWRECFETASAHLQIYPYQGSIYLDVPYQVDNPRYAKVASYLETPDGMPKHPHVSFRVLTLQAANANVGAA